MLKEYIGSNVIVFLSSNSGIGVAGGGNSFGNFYSSVNSMIKVYGKITKVDTKFVEISNTRTIFMDTLESGTSEINAKVSCLEKEKVLLNIEKIIEIMISE